ncbi:MAG: carboxypeptidase regulatory-like domain-containing protein [Bacteroidetes bacterium]|nr:carboxypeptidase regulatory-like domain-containing protein [Bacteroidota bacterium]
MKRLFFVAIATLIIGFNSIAGSDESLLKDKVSEIFNGKVEIYLSFDNKYLDETLWHALSIDYVNGDLVYTYANKSSFEILLQNNIPYSILRSPGEVDFDLNMKTWEDLLDKQTRNSWDYYPTYGAYVSMMNQFETDFPNLCKIHNIGSSVSGRDLLFAKISSDVNENNAKHQFMYTSTMHGDETTGFVLMLRLIDYLLTNYGVKDDITELLDNVEIWICPNENPDGTYTNDNSTVNGATRSNANGYDLNRNYPNPVNSPSNQQAETIAMMNFVEDKYFTMSANMHGGIELVNFPFDSWTSSVRMHADHNWWVKVSREYADSAQYYSPSGYMTAFGGITHGGDWYVVYGSRQDYMNWYKNTRELTLELSNTKLLSPSSLPAHWNYNYRSFLNYIKQSTYGIHGVVTDKDTGDPLQAMVTIMGHDKFNSEVYSSHIHGYFARPILAGTYNVRFSKYGYDNVVFENVNVSNYQTVMLDVEMTAWPSSINDEFKLPEVTIAPNPVNQGSRISITGAEGMRLNINIYNTLGVLIDELHNGTISSDKADFSLDNLLLHKPGVYFVKVSGEGVNKVLKILIL